MSKTKKYATEFYLADDKPLALHKLIDLHIKRAVKCGLVLSSTEVKLNFKEVE